MIIGLTGGIASGKSQVAQLLVQNGVKVFNLDEIGREIYDGNSLVQTKINQMLGGKVLTGQGLDRKKMRALLFSNPELKEKLESFIHPVIIEKFKKRSKAAFDSGVKLVVCEAALLVEGGYYQQCDEVIWVKADREIRKERLILRDQVSEEMAEKILNSQADEKTYQQKLKKPLIILNENGPEDLKTQVDSILKQWKKSGAL